MIACLSRGTTRHCRPQLSKQPRRTYYARVDGHNRRHQTVAPVEQRVQQQTLKPSGGSGPADTRKWKNRSVVAIASRAATTFCSVHESSSSSASSSQASNQAAPN
uniref:Uncharacterized protein n=1 Tax=Plectus sambesii TaxID=2011161 RepID=A0A914V393_9BILA